MNEVSEDFEEVIALIKNSRENKDIHTLFIVSNIFALHADPDVLQDIANVLRKLK
jgi:hypothetical protein